MQTKTEGTILDASPKQRSKFKRSELDGKIGDMVEMMIDTKIIAATLGISTAYTYSKIKFIGYTKCFITDDERKLIAKARFERRNAN